MKKLDERSHWENEWADAFSDAEQKPSELVWHNIDSMLANKEAQKYKKRAVFYKWLAAASVFLSACGAVLFLLSNPGNTHQNGLAGGAESPAKSTENPLSSGRDGKAGAASVESLDEQAGITSQGLATTQGHGGNSGLAQENDRGTVSDNGTTKNVESQAGGAALAQANQPDQKKIEQAASQIAGLSGKRGTEGSTNSIAAHQENLGEATPDATAGNGIGIPVSEKEKSESRSTMNTEAFSSGLAFLDLEKQGLMEEKMEMAAVDVQVRKVWMPTDLIKNKEEGAVPRYWLGASVATNSFDPNYQDQSPNPLAMGQVATNFKPQQASRMSAAKIESWDESQESVISLAGGVQGAAWLNEKWVVQTGVQYGTYKTSGNAGAYVDASNSNAYPLHYSNFTLDKMNGVMEFADFYEGGSKDGGSSGMTGAAVSALNTFEFISVPLSIGYVVFDKKIGLLLSPGVSSEFFLSNQLSDENELLNDYAVKTGDGPYQTVHFRGLIGAQLFYKLGENYVVSIEPAYQHAITDFHKSGSYFNSRPSNISVGAGFRYIFH